MDERNIPNILNSARKEEEEILSNTNDWRFVEFHLKSSFGNEVSINKVIYFSNHHKTTNFEKRVKNKLFSYAWREIKENHYNSSLLKPKGNEIKADSGIDFQAGSNLDHLDNNENGDTEASVFKYTLYKIIVGKSMLKILKKKDERLPESQGKPLGYDSLLVYNEFNWEDKKNSAKNFVFRIFNTDDILPLYEVEFTKSGGEYYNKYECQTESCEKKDAELFCINCNEYYCENCFKKKHEKIPHNFFKLESKIKPGICNCRKVNENNNVAFYCLECKTAICSWCKVVGSHSKGKASTHTLENIYEYYKNIVPDGLELVEGDKKNDNYSNNKSYIDLKEKLHNLKSNFNNTASILKKNFEEAKEKIKKDFEKEHKDLKTKSENLIKNLLSSMCGFLFVKDHLKWIQDYHNVREEYFKYINKGELLWMNAFKNTHSQQLIHNASFIEWDFKFDPKMLVNPSFNIRNELNLHFEKYLEDSSKNFARFKKG